MRQWRHIYRHAALGLSCHAPGARHSPCEPLRGLPCRQVLAKDAADALEVTWLDRSVAVTHVMLRQHILAAHGYKVRWPPSLRS